MLEGWRVFCSTITRERIVSKRPPSFRGLFCCLYLVLIPLYGVDGVGPTHWGPLQVAALWVLHIRISPKSNRQLLREWMIVICLFLFPSVYANKQWFGIFYFYLLKFIVCVQQDCVLRNSIDMLTGIRLISSEVWFQIDLLFSVILYFLV